MRRHRPSIFDTMGGSVFGGVDLGEGRRVRGCRLI
jgi:hypothetical protein